MQLITGVDNPRWILSRPVGEKCLYDLWKSYDANEDISWDAGGAASLQ